MKIFLLFLLSGLLMISAAQAGSVSENVTLIMKAEELAARLDELAESKAYAALFTSEEDVLSIVKEWGAGNHDKPSHIMMLDLSYVNQALAAVPADMPEAGRRTLKNGLGSMLVQSVINGQGVNTVAASSIARTSVTFAAPVVNEIGVFVLLYEDAVPVTVSWCAENGAVSMTASFLPGAFIQDDGLAIHSNPSRNALLYSCVDVEPAIVEGPPIADVPVYSERALTLAGELRTLAKSDAWLTFLGLPGASEERIRSFVAAEEETPRLIIPVTNTVFTDMPEIPALPAGVADNLGARMASAVMTSIIGYTGGAETLSAVAGIQANTIFADEGADGSGMYIMLYEDGSPVIVNWAAGEDSVSMTASFHPDEAMAACQSAEDLIEWAAQYGISIHIN